MFIVANIITIGLYNDPAKSFNNNLNYTFNQTTIIVKKETPQSIVVNVTSNTNKTNSNGTTTTINSNINRPSNPPIVQPVRTRAS
jgi:hypothetical protein